MVSTLVKMQATLIFFSDMAHLESAVLCEGYNLEYFADTAKYLVDHIQSNRVQHLFNNDP